jgi:phosphoglycerate dehydrogenase-like enzyme
VTGAPGGNAPLRVAVASDYAHELIERLAGQTPEGTGFLALSGDDASIAMDSLDDVQIAFGAPDRLVEVLPRLPSVRWVQSTWAGVTPLLRQPRRDFCLTGVKGIFGIAMAEYVLGWSLALRRSVLHHAQNRRWDFRRDAGLSGLCLGIAGTGSIGQAVAERCAPFFAEVVGLNRDGRDVPGFARCFPTAERLAFGEGIDVLALVLPDTPATDGLVDGALIGRLRHGAILINGGRANALVLDDALAALESAQLEAAVLDVFEKEPLPDDSPLWSVPGLYITSHSAAPTSLDAIADLFIDNLERYRAGRPLEGMIDFERGY